VSIDFRNNEFVSILGPSGCGKTTMLNIIGGLDRYSNGDLIINGKSTKEFTEKDWDAYRNQSVGFIFQDYNLISHLSVLGNVELALTLSGVSAKERRERAIRALERVGLADHIKKHPNQLSGGQKQRVAIARAIINNPSIILADEPTGALDTKTSVQIMDILQEISQDCLVIMVTHNNELAEQYSTRIVKVLDGNIIEDTNPYNRDGIDDADKPTKSKTSMSFFTALKLSLNNLWTKKARTLLTAFAGSIGIIGIALVLAISTGFNAYIDTVQRDSLSTMPISIQTISTNIDLAEFMENAQQNGEKDDNTITIYDPKDRSVYHKNKITQDFIDYINDIDDSYVSKVTFHSGTTVNILSQTTSNTKLVNTTAELPSDVASSEDYKLLTGKFPSNYNEVVVVVNSSNELSNTTLDALGLTNGNKTTYTPTDFINHKYRVATNNIYYTPNGNGTFSIPITDILNQSIKTEVYTNANIELTVVGVVAYNGSSLLSTSIDEGLGYTKLLTEYVHTQNLTSQIVQAQIAAGTALNVLTGVPFTEYTEEKTSITFSPEDQLLMSLQSLGGSNIPSKIEISPSNFEGKSELLAYLSAYNTGKAEADQILFTDYSELLTSTFTAMIDATSIVLIIFAAISLVVSSIMIGIITYVSVIERTKEIGVLRSLGARRKDIGRVFNAETVIIGLTAGVLGVILTLLLTIPINAIVASLAAGVNISAMLNPLHALILIVLSTGLTLIAGLVPSSIASKKDPVLALRNE
ncbi:MAG: ATP-binding cassette domain-containing protein, partial [Clostridia bacterium]|nr:ATP-binding cassette domain-containing protein [Clostridia bacterium]